MALQTGEKSEGNAFTKKLKDTPKGGKFKLGNKTYTDNSELDEDLGGMGDYMGPGDEWDINLSDDEKNTLINQINKSIHDKNYIEYKKLITQLNQPKMI